MKLIRNLYSGEEERTEQEDEGGTSMSRVDCLFFTRGDWRKYVLLSLLIDMC